MHSTYYRCSICSCGICTVVIPTNNFVLVGRNLGIEITNIDGRTEDRRKIFTCRAFGVFSGLWTDVKVFTRQVPHTKNSLRPTHRKARILKFLAGQRVTSSTCNLARQSTVHRMVWLWALGFTGTRQREFHVSVETTTTTFL